MTITATINAAVTMDISRDERDLAIYDALGLSEPGHAARLLPGSILEVDGERIGEISGQAWDAVRRLAFIESAAEA